jgi:hypothetical protein
MTPVEERKISQGLSSSIPGQFGRALPGGIHARLPVTALAFPH